jgi:hypothetical protein
LPPRWLRNAAKKSPAVRPGSSFCRRRFIVGRCRSADSSFRSRSIPTGTCRSAVWRWRPGRRRLARRTSRSTCSRADSSRPAPAASAPATAAPERARSRARAQEPLRRLRLDLARLPARVITSLAALPGAHQQWIRVDARALRHRLGLHRDRRHGIAAECARAVA